MSITNTDGAFGHFPELKECPICKSNKDAPCAKVTVAPGVMEAEIHELRDALNHIARVALAGRTNTRRDRWIAQRANSALNGDEEWRSVSFPKNAENTVLRLKARIAELEGALESDQDLREAVSEALSTLPPPIAEDDGDTGTDHMLRAIRPYLGAPQPEQWDH